MFDEQGNVLVLRSDMTIPIARLVATRYAHAEPPLRFCYFAHAYRGVRPQRGQSREFLQAGVELIGSPAPRGHRRGAERAVRRARRGGPGELPRRASATPRCTRRCSRRSGSARARSERILAELVARRLRRRRARGQGARARPSSDAELLLRVPQIRGGPEVLEGLVGSARAGRGRDARASTRCSPPRSPSGSSSTSGLVRSLGYYTGAVFQVYDPAHGVPIGSGGRYDELLGQLRPAAAGGRVRAQRRAAAHRADRRGARTQRSRAMSDLRIAVPRGALFGDTLDLLDRLGLDTSEVRENDRKLLFERRRDRHDAPVRRAHLRRGRAPPTSASPARTC